MEDRIKALENQIASLKTRNERVEGDKAWERSGMRIASIAAVTYIVAGIVLRLIGVPNFYLAALVPVVGFVLSTLSLPFLKTWWLNKRNRG